MEVLSSRKGGRSVIDVIVRWWRKWNETDSRLAEPQAGGADRMMPLGEDMVLSDLDFRAVADLRALAGRGPDEATLLPRRMAVLGLDPGEVARLEPRMFRSLYWRCTSCQSQGRCAWDLADDFAIPPSQDWRDGWQSYCPNAASLNSLSEIR
jgi:hypothetical protein